MAKKSGLGRGLSNLIPGTPDDDSSSSSSSGESRQYREIAIEDIVPNPKQPRKVFDEAELQELSATFKTVGLIEPIVVRFNEEKYEIISGERRWRAARIAGFKKIPAILKAVSDIESLEMALIENIQRQELTAVEEARAYEQWMQESGQKATELSARIGKDRATITNLVRLLKLPEEILDLVDRRLMSGGQARPLLGIADKNAMMRLARRIVQENWSARKVEDEVARLGEVTSAKKAPRKKDANLKQLEEKLRKQLTARVQVQHNKSGSGKITLHYGSLDDLDRLLASIGVQK